MHDRYYYVHAINIIGCQLQCHQSFVTYTQIETTQLAGVYNHIVIVICEETLMICVYYTAQSVATVKGIH